MHPRLSPLESAKLFDWTGGDCLYRDHLGRRVLADLEGSGFAFVDRATCLLSACSDDIPAHGFHWTYAHHLVVTTQQDGEARIRAFTGRTEMLAAESVEVCLPYQGRGWLLSPGPVIDGTERASNASPDLPTPFFLGLEGTERAHVVPAGPPARLVDAFSIADAEALRQRAFKVQNISKVTELESTFPSGVSVRAPIASHLNRASWRVALPDGVDGLLIRKTYDAFHGRQRARVLVDGAVAGWWYEPEQDRVHRWRVGAFGIETGLLRGKSEIEIAIDPPPGTPLWSVSRVEVYAL